MNWLKSDLIINLHDCENIVKGGLTKFHQDNGSSFLKKHEQYVGIYRLYDDNGKIVYVGRSANMFSRMWEHIKNASHDSFVISNRRKNEVPITKIVISLFGKRRHYSSLERVFENLDFLEMYFILVHDPPLNVCRSKAMNNLDFIQKVEVAEIELLRR